MIRFYMTSLCAICDFVKTNDVISRVELMTVTATYLHITWSFVKLSSS